jgi:hypothetical protein
MTGRPLEKVRESIPGPGTYDKDSGDLATRPKSPSYKFSTETREKIIKDENPSPTAYNIETKEKGPKWQFGSETRQVKITERAPGPGQYSPQETQPHSSAPVFSKTSKTDFNSPSDVPGPGTYEITKERPEGFTMQGRPVEKIRESIPGPGSYSPTEETATKPKSPQYTFSKETREKVIKDENPEVMRLTLNQRKDQNGNFQLNKG